MSKNTGASKFRKVNVDDYDEDKYREDDVDEQEAEGPNEAEVNTLLSQSKSADALRTVLSNPPLNTKNQAVKDRTAQLVIRVLTSFKSSEIEQAVKTLDSKSVDILMKYIYRGFEMSPDGVCGPLLAWHEKTFAAGGLGCIVRVLTDRKRV